MKRRVSMDDIVRGAEWLATQEDNKVAKVVYETLANLSWRLFTTEYSTVDFADFCEATGLDEDEMNQAIIDSELEY